MSLPTSSSWRWFELGRYRVLALPLPTNEYWTTHRIFLGAELIGRQLSVPCLSDCDWHARKRGAYATGEESWKVKGYTALTIKRQGAGRPRKADSDRELREAMSA